MYKGINYNAGIRVLLQNFSCLSDILGKLFNLLIFY